VIDMMKSNGGDPSRAVRTALQDLEQKTGGYGGVIVINAEGKVASGFNTPRMARGYMTSDMKTPIVEV
jgi:isoaspartyl peptidase/L-asparaginase-like protein (Ntn-hydrolase superfamily)